ncbi:ATP-NAD kinase-like domain-containing protein [Amylostereum chailletii]|nr:ATP-NAD kinase-like domain-containing protein [Amylostereum chailletii]
MSASNARSLQLVSNDVPSIFSFSDSNFLVHRKNTPTKPKLNLSLRRVLWAAITDHTVTVHALTAQRGIVKAEGKHSDEDKAQAEKWAQELMNAAYAGIQPQRRLLVVINPHGGPGKAAQIYRKKVEPILNAARCKHKAMITEYHEHAMKIGKELPVDEYDAVLCVSGDGIIYELYNGMLEHSTPMKALRTPIVPIPAGSGNGMSLNLHGLKDGQDVGIATLAAIKGRPMPIDLCSVVQNNKRSLSFMSQCTGLMADVDLGTEHLRFLGSNRFVYGYLRGIVTRKTYPFSISIKALETDKSKISANLQAFHKKDAQHLFRTGAFVDNEASLVPLQYISDDTDGWLKMEKPISFLYAGKGAYVSRDLMQFPASIPNDGYIDVTIQEEVPRREMVTAMDGAENGIGFWRESSLYYKALAYRLKPLSDHGYISVDGEKYPFGEIHVEVHQGLGTMMSCHGRYVTEVNAALSEPPRKNAYVITSR